MSSIPMIAVVGRSDAGKTTVIEGLVPLLAARGLRVGTLKHDAHGVEPDREGKDTWRHARAGARVVLLAGPGCVIARRPSGQDASPEELAALFDAEVDLVLVEGYSLSKLPKIEVYSPSSPGASRLASTSGLLATVRAPEPLVGVPDFDGEELPALASLLETWYLEWREGELASGSIAASEARVKIVIDGRELALKPFLRRMLAGLVRGFLSSLRGVGHPASVEISVSRSGGTS